MDKRCTEALGPIVLASHSELHHFQPSQPGAATLCAQPQFCVSIMAPGTPSLGQPGMEAITHATDKANLRKDALHQVDKQLKDIVQNLYNLIVQSVEHQGASTQDAMKKEM